MKNKIEKLVGKHTLNLAKAKTLEDYAKTENNFTNELLEVINYTRCCVNKDLDKHPIEGVDEFMLTDHEIEDTQFYCAGVEAGNRICERQCIGCAGFQRDYEQ